MASLGRDLHDRGFDVLLFDLRGHGQSDPSRLYLGRRERADIRAVMSWARRKDSPTTGSAGLAIRWAGRRCLMEAARNPQIQVAVLDSPYGDLPKLLKTQLSQHSGLPNWFNPGILLAARWIYGVRTDDLVPTRFARAWGERPLLLIHGESDTIVPVSQARAGRSRRQLLLDQDLAWRRPRQGLRAATRRDTSRTVGTFFNDHLSP